MGASRTEPATTQHRSHTGSTVDVLVKWMSHTDESQDAVRSQPLTRGHVSRGFVLCSSPLPHGALSGCFAIVCDLFWALTASRCVTRATMHVSPSPVAQTVPCTCAWHLSVYLDSLSDSLVHFISPRITLTEMLFKFNMKKIHKKCFLKGCCWQAGDAAQWLRIFLAGIDEALIPSNIKNKKKKKINAGDVTWLIEHLPSMCGD